MTTLTGTQILFEDNFSNNGQPLNGSGEYAWHINKWYPIPNPNPEQLTNPSFLGITQIRQTLPLQADGHAVIQLDTWQPTGAPAYGNGTSFWGSEAITDKAFDLNGGGVSFEGKFKYEGTQGGMITGFFAYQQFLEDPPIKHADHDELDYEILTTQLGKISTNVFVDQPGISDNPKSIAVAPGSLAEWHTYRMEWLPNLVTWYVDDVEIRRITNTDEKPHAVPVHAMQLHLNLWGVPSAPPEGLPYNPPYYPNQEPWNQWWVAPTGDPSGPPVSDKNFRPVHDASQNQKFYFDVAAVKVERLSTQLGDTGANALTGTAGNDGIDGAGGDDTLAGMNGDDTMIGGWGNDAIDGGQGRDTAIFTGARADYTLSAAGAVTTITATKGSDGTDTLTNVEILSFSDGRFDLGANGVLTPVQPPSFGATPDTVELVVHNDTYATLKGQALTVGALGSVLVNDVGGSALNASLVEGPAHGTLQFNGNGTFAYTPTSGFTGVDSFVYRTTDADGITGDATALVQVVGLTPTGTLDILSLGAEQNVAAIYTGLLGRGADAAGFGYWIAQYWDDAFGNGGFAGSIARIANAFGASAEAQALYPLLAHPAGASDAQIGTFLNAVYDNLFDRPADSGGLSYWTGQIKQLINTGQPVGSVVANIIGGAQSSGGGQDILTLLNKVAVNIEYATVQSVFETPWTQADDRAEASALIGAVTADIHTALIGIQQAHALVIADSH